MPLFKGYIFKWTLANIVYVLQQYGDKINTVTHLKNSQLSSDIW